MRILLVFFIILFSSTLFSKDVTFVEDGDVLSCEIIQHRVAENEKYGPAKDPAQNFVMKVKFETKDSGRIIFDKNSFYLIFFVMTSLSSFE